MINSKGVEAAILPSYLSFSIYDYSLESLCVMMSSRHHDRPALGNAPHRSMKLNANTCGRHINCYCSNCADKDEPSGAPSLIVVLRTY